MRIAGLILAGFVALFILAPVLVTNHWHSYGPWFANVVGKVAQEVAPSQHIVAVGTKVFTPRTEVTITTGCAGFEGIRTFSILFSVVLLLNWRRTAKPKSIALYLSAVLLLWCHNTMRIVIATVLGGETHYGTSEMAIVLLAVILASVAIRTGSVSPPGRAA